MLSVLLVFFVVLTTNLIDKDNFRRVKESIVTIYEDRLVANDLIYELSLLVHEKEMAAALSNDRFFQGPNDRVNEKIDILIKKYLTTKLTDQEASIFGMLQDDLSQLNQIEASTNIDMPAYNKQLSNIKENLYDLSKIQLKEGRNQMLLSKEAFRDVELFTRMEIYVLILLAIIIQVIILYKPKKDSDWCSPNDPLLLYRRD
jgi:hypothetical protein